MQWTVRLPNHNWNGVCLFGCVCVCDTQTSWHFCVLLFVLLAIYLFWKLSFFQWMNGSSVHLLSDVTPTSLSSVLYRLHIGSLACFALWRTFSQPFARYQGFRYNSSAYTSDSNCSLNPHVVYTHISMRVIKCKRAFGSLAPSWVIVLICKHETRLHHISFEIQACFYFLIVFFFVF